MADSLQQTKQRFGIIGTSPLLERAIQVALQVAPADIGVLVTGESGVGKEFFPQIIHQNSSRKHDPYIAVNCGAIPEGTIDSELFGHRKGSFTGALADRKGYFEEADRGTIFLDEVGELPLSTQARLLRVLETGEYIAVGTSQSRKTDVRIVAATNVNLAEAVAAGRFREDLLFRLNTVPIAVPALRDRPEDIPLLFRRFAVDSAERYHMPPIRLTEDAIEVLKGYNWPGNIRELRNLVERISILEEERTISGESIRSYMPKEAFVSRLPMLRDGKSSDAGSFSNERELLYQVLFDMRKDMNELKALVHDIMESNERVEFPHTVSKNHVERKEHLLHQDLYKKPMLADDVDTDFLELSSDPQRGRGNESAEVVYSTGAHSHEKEQDLMDESEEVISLASAEEILIRRALKKHGVKNKKEAAEALGISERTLYRKIKELDLE